MAESGNWGLLQGRLNSMENPDIKVSRSESIRLVIILVLLRTSQSSDRTKKHEA